MRAIDSAIPNVLHELFTFMGHTGGGPGPAARGHTTTTREAGAPAPLDQDSRLPGERFDALESPALAGASRRADEPVARRLRQPGSVTEYAPRPHGRGGSRVT